MSEIKNAAVVSFESDVVESRKTFVLNPETNYLVNGELDDIKFEDVEVSTVNAKTGESSTYEYAGMTIPSLALTFKQYPTKADPHDRYLTVRFTIVSTKDKDGLDIKVDTISSIIRGQFEHLQHIVNAYKGLPNYPEKPGLPKPIDMSKSTKDRIAQFKAFYKHFVDILMGTNKDEPMYKGVGLWLKTPAHYQTGKYYTFPRYVGTGFIERAIAGKKPSLVYKPGEEVELRLKTSKKATEAAITGGDVDIDPDDLRAILDMANR